MTKEKPAPARIQLAGNPTLCADLRRSLKPAWCKVLAGEVRVGGNLVQAIGEARPDIVLLDATLPELELPAALDALANMNPLPRVVVIAPEYKPLLSLAQSYPACYGTLLRELALTPLLPPVVRGIAGGSTYYLPPPKPSDLTPYQYGVLRLMAVGLDKQGVAQALRRTIHSIYSAQNEIRTKLGVETNEQAIVRAIELGLVAVLKKPDHSHLSLRRK